MAIRRSARSKATRSKEDPGEMKETQKSTLTKKKKVDTEKRKKESLSDENVKITTIQKPPSKKKKKDSDEVGKDKNSIKTKVKKAKKASDHQRITGRDEIPKLWNAKKAQEISGSYTFKICSWNVAGLRAVMRNHPNALSDLAKTYNFDMICLQETKLQEIHVDDPKLKINGHLLHEEGYVSYYNCATAKKGYSGTAVFIKDRKDQLNKDVEAKGKESKKKQSKIGNFFKKPSEGKKSNDEDAESKEKKEETIDIDVKNLIPSNVSFEFGIEKHDTEGRMIIVDFPLFSTANLYVPNSGQKLDRLSYRTDEWDKDLVNYMKEKMHKNNVPVVWLGDLNVAHTNKDVWNDGAKHLAKSAGTTPEERNSFQEQLESGFVDVFRHLHPEAMGQYTYWSQRAGNREPNKGLRLDYFICSKDMVDNSQNEETATSFEKKVFVRDSYIIHDQMGSDHCPIVLEMEIRK